MITNPTIPSARDTGRVYSIGQSGQSKRRPGSQRTTGLKKNEKNGPNGVFSAAAGLFMSQETIDARSRAHTPAIAPAPDKNGERRLVKLAVVVVVISVVGSVIMSRHAERRLFFSHAALVGIAAELAILALFWRRRVLQILETFFTAAAHPMNLAIFRMAVFGALFKEVHLAGIVSFSRMPSGLQFAPWGMSMLLPHLPIDAIWARIAAVLLLVFATTGFIGFFSRTSALACALLGFYALGIPDFYGKVDHNHHLIWFAVILAVSPCGDFFALDAVAAARKRADQGITDPPPPSQLYAFPLRFVMLLIGAIYFFPGFWKLWQSGFDWFLTDGLRHQLYLFWTWSYDGLWLPTFRIDQHVLVCRIAAAATILFELSFIFLMFHRKLRVFAALEGLVFHTSTNWFMKISFLSLRVCYVALLDWEWILGHVGRALWREELFFVYDETCVSSRRMVGFVRVWDVFNRVTYINGADQQAVTGQRLRLPERGENSLAQSTFAVVHNKSWIGFSAYRALAWRIPVLWPMVPILYSWPTKNQVSAIYKQPAEAPSAPAPSMRQIAGRRRVQLKRIAVVGSILLLGAVCGGVSKHIDGWPFACYPTFSSPPPEQIASLSVVAVAPSGGETEVRNFGFPYHRFYGLSRNILAIDDPVVRDDRLLLLWGRAVQVAPELRPTAVVKFYVENLWIDPALWNRNPENRKLLFVWHPPSNGSVPQAHAKTHLSYTEWQ